MTRQPTARRCGRCGLQKPLTEQFWYFHKTGSRRGKTTGFCRTCQNAVCREYNAELAGVRLARRRVQQRDSARRQAVVSRPERYQPSLYEALLDLASEPPNPLPAYPEVDDQRAAS